MFLIILLLFVLFGIILTICILYLLTLQNTLKAISPQNRKMEPGMVWLLLIPLFNIVWQFIVVNRLSVSIESEYTSRGLTCKSRPTYNIGLAFSILSCINLVLYRSTALGSIVSLAVVVCWIIYWVQVNDYKKELQRMAPADYVDSEIFGNLNR
jgi:hypothetical protein